MSMHPELDQRLKKWKADAVKLREVESVFRQAEATKKSIFAQMYSKAEGKTVADKEYATLANPEWVALVESIAKAETEYNFQRMVYEISQNAYYGILASIKRESDQLDKRGV